MGTGLDSKQKRARNVRDYLERFFSENQIRQMYALFLSGNRRKYFANQRVAIQEAYDDCPRRFKAQGVKSTYDEVIEYLIDNWDNK